MNNRQKLYGFVDETGQDTLGSLFIVAIVIIGNRQSELEQRLENLENSSGKNQRKWMRTRNKERLAYISGLLHDDLPADVFARSFKHAGIDFDSLEVLAIAEAITAYRHSHKIKEDSYKVTITIDGLSKTSAKKAGSEFRKLGLRTRKIIGKKDESSALLRLADAIAGLVREAQEDRQEYKQLLHKLKQNHKVILL